MRNFPCWCNFPEFPLRLFKFSTPVYISLEFHFLETFQLPYRSNLYSRSAEERCPDGSFCSAERSPTNLHRGINRTQPLQIKRFHFARNRGTILRSNSRSAARSISARTNSVRIREREVKDEEPVRWNSFAELRALSAPEEWSLKIAGYFVGVSRRANNADVFMKNQSQSEHDKSMGRETDNAIFLLIYFLLLSILDRSGNLMSFLNWFYRAAFAIILWNQLPKSSLARSHIL